MCDMCIRGGGGARHRSIPNTTHRERKRNSKRAGGDGDGGQSSPMVGDDVW